MHEGVLGPPLSEGERLPGSRPATASSVCRDLPAAPGERDRHVEIQGWQPKSSFLGKNYPEVLGCRHAAREPDAIGTGLAVRRCERFGPSLRLLWHPRANEEMGTGQTDGEFGGFRGTATVTPPPLHWSSH